MTRSPVKLVEPLESAIATPEELFRYFIAYRCLLTPCHLTKGDGRSPRSTLVECSLLLDCGVGIDELSWMLYQAHVNHFVADSQAVAPADWTLWPSAVVKETSAFALTPGGQAFGKLLIARIQVADGNREIKENWDLLKVGRLAPRYDEENRRFCWGAHVLKCYRQPAGNQETILKAEEEDGWPPWLDDPLPPQGKMNPKVRRHDAIKFLNRDQCPHLVHFKGDGTGTRVGWELR